MPITKEEVLAMAKLAKNKKYLRLDDVRISYRAQEDTIHLSSGDGDLSTGFHLALAKDTVAEAKLRELLEHFGLIEEGNEHAQRTLPQTAPLSETYFTDPSVSPYFFPLGLGVESAVMVKTVHDKTPMPVLGFNVTGHVAPGQLGTGMENTTAPHVLLGGGTGGGKSVVQRNIIMGCLMRPEHWSMLLIDLYKVELSGWRGLPGVLGVATNMEDAVVSLRFAHDTMMKRYELLEQLGLNHFLDLPDKPKALMIMVDEIFHLLTPTGVKTKDGLRHDAFVEEVKELMDAILTLGRAAGVHLVCATQQANHSTIPQFLKVNFGVRIHCGRATETSSMELLENTHGTQVRANPRGRFYLQVYGQGKHGQGFFGAPDQCVELIEQAHGERSEVNEGFDGFK